MPSSAPAVPHKAKMAQDNTDYARSLRSRRKEQGFELVHWYIHHSAYEAIAKAAARDNRNVQQYVTLNIWQMVPEDLRPEDIGELPIVIPKKKRVVLNIKVQRSAGSQSPQG
jgi:hypothetical protein